MELSFFIKVTGEQEVYFELNQSIVDKIKELIKFGTIKCDKDIYEYLFSLNDILEPDYEAVEEFFGDKFVCSSDEYFEQLSA